MTGWGEYDLLGPSLFMATADRVAFAACPWAGLCPRGPHIELKRRLMALMLLHQASDPVRHLCIERWQDKADDFLQLQELIWVT